MNVVVDRQPRSTVRKASMRETAHVLRLGDGMAEAESRRTAAYKSLRLEYQDDIAVLTLDNPPHNTLPLEVSDQFPAIADTIRESTARVVIVTGSGQSFCVGPDPADLELEATGCQLRWQALRVQRNLRALADTGRPLIAAINGRCVGLGLELALTCHLRIASEDACFAAPEVSMGFVPRAGGTQLLPRLIGRGRAYELMLTGDSIHADAALQWGLVNRVVKPEKCVTAAFRLARCIAAKGALAVASVLEAVERGLDVPLAEGLRIEAGLMAVLGESADRREGLQAFVEERVPIFRERPPSYVRYL